MRDPLSTEEMEMLANYSNGLCVSIFMPTETAGRETEQNPIYLKNLLPQAEQQLIDTGMSLREAREVLKPGADLINNREFWQHQSEGLALFFAEDSFFQYRLPIRFENMSVVGPHFHLKPLMPVITGDGDFYILALAQGENRLFHATRHTVEELEAEQIPASLAEALWYYEQQPMIQNRNARAPGLQGAEKAGQFHGQGEGDPRNNKDYIIEYFRHIDTGLTDFLKDEKPPLVLAGVEYLLPIYQEANTYDNLVKEGLTGSPKVLSGDELREKAWEIVRKHFDAPRLEAFERFNNMTGTGLAVTEIEDIVPAAYYGRVETLFVAHDLYRWGRFDPDTNQLEFSEESSADNEDLLDRAAVQTFLNSGTAYVVDVSQIPGSGEIAAIYRY
jgi:hypothetical protein